MVKITIFPSFVSFLDVSAGIGDSYHGTYTFFTCVSSEGTTLRAQMTVIDISQSNVMKFYTKVSCLCFLHAECLLGMLTDTTVLLENNGHFII